MQKYMHIERVGKDDVDGLLSGTVYVQPKLDGTNGQIYFEDLLIKCASKNHVLSDKSTNQGFWNYVQDNHDLFLYYFMEYPNHILYGEWLVPHTLKTYRKDAWRNFYVFDIFDIEKGIFIPYDVYKLWLESANIQFIPVIAKVYNPNNETLLRYLEQNTFLIEDGKGFGEGIVLKNYEFVNKYGRVTWGKLVRNEFKEEFYVTMGYPEQEWFPIELKIAQEFVTPGRIEKMKLKMLTEKPWDNRRIPEYLGRIWNEIIEDEMWNIIKKHKNPKIDFNSFYRFVIQQIKILDKEIF